MFCLPSILLKGLEELLSNLKAVISDKPSLSATCTGGGGCILLPYSWHIILINHFGASNLIIKDNWLYIFPYVLFDDNTSLKSISYFLILFTYRHNEMKLQLFVFVSHFCHTYERRHATTCFRTTHSVLENNRNVRNAT